MAELTQSDLYTLFRDTNDIRKDIASSQGELRYDIGQNTNETIKETMKAASVVGADVKDASYSNAVITKDAAFQTVLATKDANYAGLIASHENADRVVAQSSAYYIAAQAAAAAAASELAALKSSTDASFAKLASDVAQHAASSAAATALASANSSSAIAVDAAKNAAAIALEGAKNATANSLGHAQLERSIVLDGGETRRLINELRVSDLERKLVERSADIHGFRHEANHWRGHFDQSQFASLSNQIQMVGSVAQEARQGVTNFGSMSGNAGRQNATNNVA